MRTNVVINDTLMNEALKYSKFKTKKDVINQALREFVRNQELRKWKRGAEKALINKEYGVDFDGFSADDGGLYEY